MHEGDHDQAEEILEGELVESPPTAPVRRAGPALPSPGTPNLALDWARGPAAQNAFAAATGFVAGAATLALARRIGSRKLERALASARSDDPLISPGAPLGAGRTYIVHVRQIGVEPFSPGVHHHHHGRPHHSLPPALGPGTQGE